MKQFLTQFMKDKKYKAIITKIIKRKRNLYIAIVGFILFGNLSTLAAMHLFTAKDKPHYITESISRGGIEKVITATGTLNAVTTVKVGAQVTGTISRIFVDYNSPVKKGQLLAQIDPSTYEAQLEQARANHLSTRANISKCNAALLDSKRTRGRYKELWSQDLIARQELDTAETNYESCLAQLDAARAQAAQAMGQVKAAEANLRYTRIVSPIDGTIISKSIDVGQTVVSSFVTPNLFSIAENLDQMQIEANVDESDISLIAPGQNVDFTVDSYQDTIFHGKVSQVRIEPITVQNVVTYIVVIKVDNKEKKLRPGMTANVKFKIDRSDNALRIPNAALRFIPAGQDMAWKNSDSKPGVWILEGGKLQRIEVKTGLSDNQYTEMKSGELYDGQSVIVDVAKKKKVLELPSR